MEITTRRKHELFLDWFNNFLTVPCFAEHYGLTDIEAQAVISEGRTIHEAGCAKKCHHVMPHNGQGFWHP